MKRFLSLLIATVMVLSLIPAVSFAAETRTVYWDPVSGADTNDGLTEAAPVKSVEAAYAALSGADAGVLVLQDTLTLSAQTTFPGCDIPVTITGGGISTNNHIFFAGDTTLENMTLTLAAANNTTYLSSEGHDLTIGEGITCKNSSTYRFCLTTRYGEGSNGNATLTVKSGNWRNVFVGGYNKSTSGNATLIMTGGNVNNLIAPTFSGNLSGNTTMHISGVTGGSICCTPNQTGVITGNVDITLGDGVSGKLRIKRLFQNATVNGTATVTIDGDCSGLSEIAHVGSAAGSITKSRLVLKSGVLDVTPCAIDEVALEIPSGKTFTLEGCSITADTVSSAGTLVFSGEASLTAAAVTGSLSCDISGTPAVGHTYVTAPTGSSVTFPASTGVTEENGVWATPGAFDESTFKGLVIRAEVGVSVNLYSQYKANTGEKQTPSMTVEEDGIVSYYYPGAAGPYRCVTSRSGYYKVTKNIFMSAAEAATCTEHIVKMEQRAGGTATDTWEPSTYQAHTDEVLAMEAYDDDITQWPEYADVFTTPWFTEEHAAQQITTQAQVETFIEKLDDEEDNMYIFSIGKSEHYQHDVWAVFFTETDLSSAETYEEAVELMGQDKPAVLYRAQIHGNEPAAGEAALAVVQRMDGEYGSKLTKNINVIIVPRAGTDGAQNFLRTLPSGIDPNRDMLRLESQEIRDYVQLYNALQPELVIDGHEYNGYANAEYHWDSDITVGLHFTGNNTEAYAQTNLDLAHGIFHDMAANGLTYNFYSSRVNAYNNTSVSRPYFGQMGALSILLETRGNGAALVSYARRIISQVISVEHLLSYVSDNAAAVQQLVDAERQQIVEKGKTYREEDQVYLYITTAACAEEKLTLKRIYQNGTEKDMDLTPNIVNNVQRARTAPTAYVIPAGASFTEKVLSLMDQQFISYTYIPAGATVQLRQYTGTAELAALTEEKAVTFGQGAYVFTMNQVPAYILTHLMEPDVDDVAENAGTLAQQGIITPVGGYFPIYRYCQDLNANGFISYHMADAEPVHATVYLDGTNGDDTSNGLTETAPVKTLEQAYAALSTALSMGGEGSTGTIVISGMYDLGKKIYELPSVSFHVTITGKTADDGIKYTGVSVAEPINRSITLHGDTTFENLTIFADSGYTHNLIVANGHKLVMGEGVNSICREGKTYYFTIYGGAYYEGEEVASTDVTIRSGTWRAVYAGGYNSIVTGTAKLDISGATVYDSIYASRMGNIGHLEMSISDTEVLTGYIYAGSQTANSPKKLGYVKNGVTITLGKNVTAANLYCSAKTYGGIAGGVTVIADGVDFTKVPLVARCPDLSASYSTAWILVKLARDMATDVTLEPAMALDLCGYDITGNVTVDGSLTVFDSATDDYDVSDGLYGEITGTVTGTLEAADGYVAAAKGFHRFDQYISGVSLRPSNAGIYYTATVLADEVLRSEFASQGVAVSLTDLPGVDFETDEDTLYATGSNGVLVQNILKGDGEDADRGIMDIYAASYVKLQDGTVLVSDENIAYSLYDVLLLIRAQNPDTLNSFLTKWNIQSWFN